MTHRSRHDYASQDDLKAGRSTEPELPKLETIVAVEEQTDFCWSDDSWDPMTREIVGLYSCGKTAKHAIAQKTVPEGKMDGSPWRHSNRGAFDLINVDVVWDEVPPSVERPLYVVFKTTYLSISHYGDEEGRLHLDYRTDRSGYPLKAFSSPIAAEQLVAELNHKAREVSPRGDHSGTPYIGRYWRSASPSSYGQSLEERTSLSKAEFEAALTAISPQHQGTWKDENETPEEAMLLDEQARQYWRLMDRVVLFKIITMSFDDN